MTKEYFEDLCAQANARLLDYLRESTLPLDEPPRENPSTLCPKCGRKARILRAPPNQGQGYWRCSSCKEQGAAISYAMAYFGIQTELGAVIDICRKLGIRIRQLQTITARELVDTDFPPPVELIEGMLKPGLYILAGASKIGKSWLGLEIADHVSTGKPLWGRKTLKCGVLYLSLEDTEQRIQGRLLKVCDGKTGEITFATEAEVVGMGFEEQVTAFLKANPNTKLVIVDALIKVRDMNARKYSYAEDYATMTAFKHLAERFGIALLVVHHTRKLEAEDIMNMISGTTGLMGCADGAMVLDRPNRLRPEASLSITGRDIADDKILLQQDPENMRWEFVGRRDEQPRDEKDMVLETLARVVAHDIFWEGTAQELVWKLVEANPKLDGRLKPNALSRRLSDNKDLLRERFEVDFTKYRKLEKRMIALKSLAPRNDVNDDDNASDC